MLSSHIAMQEQERMFGTDHIYGNHIARSASPLTGSTGLQKRSTPEGTDWASLRVPASEPLSKTFPILLLNSTENHHFEPFFVPLSKKKRVLLLITIFVIVIIFIKCRVCIDTNGGVWNPAVEELMNKVDLIANDKAEIEFSTKGAQLYSR